MKSKQFMQRLLWVAITLMMTTTVLTSCTDNNEDNATPELTVTAEQPTTPTEDAIAVKYDGNYVVYGELNDGISAALQRRLQGTMTSPMNADCFVINPTGLGQLNMSIEEWKNLIRRTYAGEGSIVLTQCSFINFYNFFTAYFSTLLYMQQENYQGDTDTEAQTRAQVSRWVANIVRNAYMAGGHSKDAMTRGTEVNGQELDWEHIDQWPKEKQMATMFDAYAFSGGNEIYVLNAEASKYLNEQVSEQPDNDYEWGQKADAIVDWLNRQSKDDAETRAGLADFTRSVNRASGNTAISDLMNAQTMEFVFDYYYPDGSTPNVGTAYSAIKVHYTAYSAYDFSGNVEYYQVRQNITVMNDKIYNSPAGNSWWCRNDGDWTLARGDWMKRIYTKMWLEGSGTKSVVSAAPLNENGSSSGSSSSGGGTTHTEGGSDGYSIGGSVGMSGLNPTFSISGSYSHTKTYSDATSTTWNTSTNWNTKDLTTTFTQGNDANGSVVWTHTGNTPKTGDDAHVSKLKPLLISTCTTDEQALWKIQNPSGIYTLCVNLDVVSELIKIKWSGSKYIGEFVSKSTLIDLCFELNAPDRFKRKWNNVIYDYGTAPEGMSQIEYTGYIDNFIEKSYGNNSANFCWAGLFVSTEATANGSDNARAVFQTFKNSIRGMKQQLRAKGISGRLVFGLKRDGADANGNPYDLTDQIVLALDGTAYNEGETFTEQLNGYDITYKVTKKGSEVELSNVPNNFSGELIIPEKVNVMLNVTALGSGCASYCKGITAVTIPSSVHTIEYSALRFLDITEINIPEGVQTVGDFSFDHNTKLTKVYLPSTVTSIMIGAFYHCNAITQIHIKATTPPELDSNSFVSVYNKATLYVPAGCKEAYANAKEWKKFKNIVEE